MLRVANSVNSFLRCRAPIVAQQQCGLRQSVEERLGLPEKPKKPASAFIRFINQARSEISSKNPGIAQKDILKIGSQMWKSANEQTKKKLQDEFKHEMENYAIRISKYNNSLSPQQKEEIKEAFQELKEEKQRREERLANSKRNKELGKPVKPLGAFFLFAKSEQHNRGDKTVREFQVELSNKWQSLSESTKQKFIQEAAKALELHEKALEAWEKKMINAGNVDVVRQKTIDKAGAKAKKSDEK